MPNKKTKLTEDPHKDIWDRVKDFLSQGANAEEFEETNKTLQEQTDPKAAKSLKDAFK